MRNSLLLLSTLFALSGYAQSSKLPQRRASGTSSPSRQAVAPAQRQVAPSSAAAATTTRPAAVRAEERPTSAKLPENRTTQAAPPPAPRPGVRQASAPRRRRGGGGGYSGGLAYAKGDNLLQIGVGLSSYYYGNPFGITYEHGVSDDISFGAQLDYNSSTYGGYGYYYGSYYNSYRWGYTATYFGLRGSYHLNKMLGVRSDKFDLYAGLGLGYISFRWRDDYYGDADYGSRVFLNYFIGAKYYFTPKIGAFAELGYTGLSSTRIGLAAKF
jgi:hypothetical protein